MEEAAFEFAKLNGLNKDKGAHYFWRTTRFYDPASQVFVGSANGTITTVIPGATQNYINNLLGVAP